MVAMPPLWLLQAAVAAVWLYEGLWCKVLARSPHEFEVVEQVPFLARSTSHVLLRLLGVLEALLGAHAAGATTVGGSLGLPEGLPYMARCDYYCGWYMIHPRAQAGPREDVGEDDQGQDGVREDPRRAPPQPDHQGQQGAEGEEQSA